MTGKEDTYTGMTGRSFKERLYEHNTDMNIRPKQNQNGKQKKNNTKLRKHIWKLKDQSINFTWKWRILDRAPTFNPNKKMQGMSKRKILHHV